MDLLCSPEWPWICGDPSASASQLLWLQAFARIYSVKGLYDWLSRNCLKYCLDYNAPSIPPFFLLPFFLFLILIPEPRALDILDKSSARLTCVVLVNYKQYWCHVPRLIQVSTVTVCLLGFSTLCETSLFVVAVCSPGNRSPDHIHSRPTPCHWAVSPAPTKSFLLKRFRFDTASRKWLII